MNKQPILLFRNGGPEDATEEIKNILHKNPYPDNRLGEVVEYIQKHGIRCVYPDDIDIRALYDDMLANPDRIYQTMYKGYECEDTDEYKCISSGDSKFLVWFVVEDVDLDRKWHIVKNEYGEFIEYVL